jgi:D-alanyl-D-alanine carboxypeptidase
MRGSGAGGEGADANPRLALGWRRSFRLVGMLVVVAIAAAACATPAPTGSPVTDGPTMPPSAAAVAPGTPAPASPPAAVGPASAQAVLDAARRNYGAPGALAVVRRGNVRTWVASGTADTSGTQITDATRFRIASITKPIVAALVLDAVARDEVGLDDVVGGILPGVLRPEPPVTVRQLLSHTSGIFDESNGVSSQAEIEADIAKLIDPALRAEAASTLAQVVAGKRVIASDRVLVGLSETHDRYFAPGSGYHYSNTNFQLAAMVLEKVTGTSLADLLRTRIVEPLVLEHTTIAPPDTAAPEMRGYAVSADGSLADVTDDLGWFGNGGNGGIIASADDLLTMMQAIVSGKLLTPDLTKEMLTPRSGTYGLGIGEYQIACGPSGGIAWGHQGGVNGQASIALVSADGADGAVVAMNLRKGDDPDLYRLAQDLLCAAG